MRALALILAAAVSIAPAEGATRRRIVGRGTGMDLPFGVNVMSHSDPAQIRAALDLAQVADIRWVRVQFTWSTVQPVSAGSADFSTFDQIVTRANQNNLHILGVLGYATPWNTTAPASETRPAQREHYPPANYDAWSRYIFTTATLYKKFIHHWEIWNEPDLGSPPDETHTCNGFWCGTPAQYAQLLSVAYKSIKSADPTATVLLGGLALAGAEQNQNFLFDILTDPDNPATGSFDIMNFHAYGSRSEALKRMNFVKSQLAFGGATPRPIWITEFGYGSAPSVQNVAPYFGGEEGQAAYVRDLAPYLLLLGAQKVFWFQLFDAGSDELASYGLLTSSLNKKQAFDAYSTTIKAYHP